jgi:hypothetical protein
MNVKWIEVLGLPGLVRADLSPVLAGHADELAWAIRDESAREEGSVSQFSLTRAGKNEKNKK